MALVGIIGIVLFLILLLKLDRKYTEYYSIDINAERLVLDVGYAVAGNVPDDVVQLAKEIVKSMYYEQETNKTIEDMLSPTSTVMLEQLKRFVI
jgi:hypothetical protein